jgi:hypothetical protein
MDVGRSRIMDHCEGNTPHTGFVTSLENLTTLERRACGSSNMKFSKAVWAILFHGQRSFGQRLSGAPPIYIPATPAQPDLTWAPISEHPARADRAISVLEGQRRSSTGRAACLGHYGIPFTRLPLAFHNNLQGHQTVYSSQGGRIRTVAVKIIEDHEELTDPRQSKLSQEQLGELQRSTHFDKKELQQWYKGKFSSILICC